MMLPKKREYYLTTTPCRDFTWFSFRRSAMPEPAKNRVEQIRRSIPQTSRTKGQSIADQPGQILVAKPAKARSNAVKPRKSKSNPNRAGAKSHGRWSDWYVGEDSNYFWRARRSRHEENWEYQFTAGHQQPREPESRSSTASSSEPSRAIAAVSPSRSPNPTSPKSSWPTIITTSTGEPTEDLSASSSRNPTTVPKEIDDSQQQQQQDEASGSALVPLAITPRAASSRRHGNSAKPVGPVLRLLQEGRSRRGKTKSAASKSGKPHPKRLHAKVKSEKELKVDPKRRVKLWLKGVEVDMAPIPLDGLGFPIYR